KADGDEGALGNVLRHFVDVEKLVEPDVGCEMQGSVEECEQSDHAPDANQPGLACEAAERRDGERNQDKSKCPVAGRVGNDLDGIRAQAAVERLPGKAFERDQRGEEDHDFCQAELHFVIVDWVIFKFSAKALLSLVSTAELRSARRAGTPVAPP